MSVKVGQPVGRFVAAAAVIAGALGGVQGVLAQPFQSYYSYTPVFDPYAIRARDLQRVFDRPSNQTMYAAANAGSSMITRFKPSGNVVGMWRYAALLQDQDGNCDPLSEYGISIDTLEQTSDGGYIVAFTGNGPYDQQGTNLGYNVGLMKLDATGGVTWASMYRGTNAGLDQIHKCQPGVITKQTRDARGTTNGYVLCYSTTDIDPDSSYHEAGVLLKTDLGGDIVFFTRVFGVEPGDGIALTDVEVTPTGFAVSGTIREVTSYRPLLLEFDAAGTLVNAVRYKHATSFLEPPQNLQALGHGLTPVDNGDFVMSIGVNTLPVGDAGMIRISPGGAVVWSNSWHTGASPGYQAVGYQNFAREGGLVVIAGPCEVGWGQPSFAITCKATTGALLNWVSYDLADPDAVRRGFDAIAPRIDTPGWAFSGSSNHQALNRNGQLLLVGDASLTQACPFRQGDVSGATTSAERIRLDTDSNRIRYKWCVKQHDDPRTLRVNSCGQ